MLIFVLFIAFFIGIAVLGSQQTKKRRAPIQAQIDAMQAQMGMLHQQAGRLDAGTAARVTEAHQAVEAKLQQARSLLASASKENHYARIARLLEQTQTKITNAQGGVERAQGRLQAKEQRQEQRQQEAQQRSAARAQRSSFGAARTPSRTGGSFAPPASTTNRQTDWNTVSPNARGVSFFSGRPALLSELIPITVPVGGKPQRVLVDAQDYQLLQSGQMPPMRVFSQNGRSVPWYAYRGYDPYRDYYGYGYDNDWMMGRIALDLIDSVYWNLSAPMYMDGGYGYGGDPGYVGDPNMDGNGYVFTPDAPAYQDYQSEQAAGSADFNANDGPVFPADFQNNSGNGDPYGDPADVGDFPTEGMMAGGMAGGDAS